MITCTVSGIRYKLHPAPAELHWPHPALSYGFKFPTPRTQEDRVLQFAAALYALMDHGIVEHTGPLRPEEFTSGWLASIQFMLKDLHNHLQGCGTIRLSLYPKIVISRELKREGVERWVTECIAVHEEYKALSSPERDIANEQHRRIVAAKAKAINLHPVERLHFIEYLERCAVDCALDGDSRYSFLRTCKNPQGSSDRAIDAVLQQLHDWAPQETLEDQLNFDCLIQRLTDALLDSRTRTEVRQAQLNAELSKGLFRARAFSQPTAPTMKEKQQGVVMSNLAALLAKLPTL